MSAVLFRTLPELPVQYADFACCQRQWLQGDVLEKYLAYWRGKLGGDLPPLELPTDRPRPLVQSRRGAERSFNAFARGCCRARAVEPHGKRVAFHGAANGI